ncbi:MAG: hypothetical protein R3E53_10975 [Myxococcota bacterium]
MIRAHLVRDAAGDRERRHVEPAAFMMPERARPRWSKEGSVASAPSGP